MILDTVDLVGVLNVTVDNDNDTATATLQTNGLTAGSSIALSGGTDGDDTIDLNADIQAGTTLMVSNAQTVDLAADVDLTTLSGALAVLQGVTLIDLSGVTGTNVITATVGSVSLAALSDSGTPAELEINSDTSMTLTSADIANLLDVNVDVDDDGSETLDSGALSAGAVTVDGSSDNETFQLQQHGDVDNGWDDGQQCVGHQSGRNGTGGHGHDDFERGKRKSIWLRT